MKKPYNSYGGGAPWKKRSGGDFDRPSMHKATCAKCGNECQVPFKPNGRKPVYCSNCFVKDGDAESPRSSGRGRGGKPSFWEDRASNLNERDDSAVQRQLREINEKLDAIIEALED